MPPDDTAAPAPDPLAEFKAQLVELKAAADASILSDAEFARQLDELAGKEAADDAEQQTEIDQLKDPGPPAQLEPNPDAPPIPPPAPPADVIPPAPAPSPETVTEATDAAAENAAAIDTEPEPAAATETAQDVYRNFLAALDKIVDDARTVDDLAAQGYTLYRIDPATGDASPAIPAAPSTTPPPAEPAEPALVEGVDVDQDGEPFPTTETAPEPAPVKGVDVPLTQEEVIANLIGPLATPAAAPEPAPVDNPDPTISGDHPA